MEKATQKAAAPAAPKKAMKKAMKKAAAPAAPKKAAAPAAPRLGVDPATKKTPAAKAAPSMWEDFVQRHYVNKGHAIPDESRCAWQVEKNKYLGWPLPAPKQFSTDELRLDEGHIHEKARAHLDEWTGTAPRKRWREGLLVPVTTCVLSLTLTKENSHSP